MAVRIDDVRDLTAGLPRSYEVLVRGRVKFRVGRIVYLAFSRDETLMGFAFPKEEREAALETYPDKFLRPKPSDMRFRWLDFLLVGGGRMLVMFGAAEGGLHLFWVGKAGFEKASFVPCEAFPEPIVRAEGDKLVAIVSHDGKAIAHEMLWWGP